MKQQLKKTGHGFTIIEVMIVLAIAGLIMAIVFFAVPQLQRNARDNQRQSVANRVKAELDTFASNNQGAYPFVVAPGAWPGASNCTQSAGGAAKSCQDFNFRYLSNVNINDPSTNAAMPIFIAKTNSLPSPTSKGTIYIAVGAECNGDNIQASAASGNSTYALVVGLDRTNTRYCVDNG
jgi:prepilin-type N-terminal cleavage/methylation domain-containing protein